MTPGKAEVLGCIQGDFFLKKRTGVGEKVEKLRWDAHGILTSSHALTFLLPPPLIPTSHPHIPTSSHLYSHFPAPLPSVPNLPSWAFPCRLFPFSCLVCFSHRWPLSHPTLAFIGFLLLFFFLPFLHPFPSRKKTPGSCWGLDELLTLLGLDSGRNFIWGCVPSPTPGSQISSSQDTGLQVTSQWKENKESAWRFLGIMNFWVSGSKGKAKWSR